MNKDDQDTLYNAFQRENPNEPEEIKRFKESMREAAAGSMIFIGSLKATNQLLITRMDPKEVQRQYVEAVGTFLADQVFSAGEDIDEMLAILDHIRSIVIDTDKKLTEEAKKTKPQVR